MHRPERPASAARTTAASAATGRGGRADTEPPRTASYAQPMAKEVLRVNGEPPRSGYRERNSTADRTLDILGMFQPGRLRVSAQQVADELGVARSTAYRYLQTLSAEAYI